MALLPFGSRTSLTGVLPLTGGTMTGNINMQTNAIILKSPGGISFGLTVDEDGALVTTQLISYTGQSIGMFPLTITYA